MADIQRQIEAELPTNGIDALTVAGGMAVAQVIGNTFKPTPGKTDMKPFLVIVLAVLATVFIRNKSVKLLAFGVIGHQLIKLLFKDSTTGKATLAGVKPHKTLGRVEDRTGLPKVLIMYDDTHLMGLGCPDCGGTCEQAKLLAQAKQLGCCQILGLGNVTQYLSVSQLSDIRTYCPGLENKLNEAIDTGIAQGKTVESVTVDAQNCGGVVNFKQMGSTMSPTSTGNNNAVIPVGAFGLASSCTTNGVSFTLVQQVNQYAGVPVTVDGGKYTNARIVIKENGNIISNRQFTSGQDVVVEITPANPSSIYSAGLEITIDGEMRYFEKNGVICAKSVQTSSVQVSVPKSNPVTAPSVQSLFTYTVDNCSSQVQFYDNSPNAYSRRWDFGDGLTLTEKNPLVNLTPGIRQVKLTAYGNDGTSSVSTQTIVVPESKPKPTVSFQAGTQSGSRIVTFKPSVQNGVQYLWDFGDGTTDGSPNPSHEYKTSGLKVVTLTVRNECGSTSYTLKINVPDVATVPEPVKIATPPRSLQVVETITVTDNSGSCVIDTTPPPTMPAPRDNTTMTVPDGLPRGWVFNKGVRSVCDTTCLPCATTCKPCITDACASYRKRTNPRQSIYKK